MLRKTIAKTLCFISFLSLLGAANAGDFILGIYGVNNPKDLGVIKRGGFNAVQTYNKSADGVAALAAQARLDGLKILVYPNNIFDSKYAQAAQNWPLFAWYLIDEPDIFNTPVKLLKDKDAKTKAAFPTANTAFVLSSSKPKLNYYPACDIVMLDWYPVPHLPLESLGEHIAQSRKTLTEQNLGQKPLIAVVQAFDWKDFEQHRPDKDRIGRYPTAQEINFMSFHSILSGANGLFYFSYSEASKTPQKWAALTATVKQIKYLNPVLTRGKTLNNPSFILAPLMAKHIAYGGKRYLIVLNPTNKTVPAPKQLFNAKYQLLFSARGFKKQAAGGIGAYSVYIFVY